PARPNRAARSVPPPSTVGREGAFDRRPETGGDAPALSHRTPDAVDAIAPRQKEETMLNLNTIMVCSEDPEALSAFYTKVLGEPAWDQGGYVGWQPGSAMLMIGPHSDVKGRNEMPGRIIFNFESPDFKDEFERIKG